MPINILKLLMCYYHKKCMVHDIQLYQIHVGMTGMRD